MVKLAVTKGEDIRVSNLTHKDGFPAGQVREIVQDDQGFLWFNNQQSLIRYDGYRFKSYTRDAAHPNYPSGGVNALFKDRSGYLWVSGNEALYRFDPPTETSESFRVDRNNPRSLPEPVSHISQDRAGMLWLATHNGLHRLDPATGTIRHYSGLSSPDVNSAYEDREGTFWVCTMAGLDRFDRRTEKVTEHVPLPSATIAMEDHAGLLWIIYPRGNGLASWDRRAHKLTRYSFKEHEPAPTELSGAERIYEDPDGNLWLTTYGSGLVKIDPSRRKATQYRATGPGATVDMDSLMGLLEDREGIVWLGIAGGGVDKFRRKPLPFHRWVVAPHSFYEPFITIGTSVYADKEDNVWVGSPIGLLRIDGKSGDYSLFRAGPGPANLSNQFVTAIAQDRSGYLWIGTYGGGLNRYDPRTRRFTAFRHNPADTTSLSHDTVYSVLVDHEGGVWAGTENGLNRCDDPVTGRFHSWRAGPAGSPPQSVTGIAEDAKGTLWLASSTLQHFDPAAERFTAFDFEADGTEKGNLESSSTLVRSGKAILNGAPIVGHSGLIWAPSLNGLVRFDPDKDLFTTYDERDGLPSHAVADVLEDHNGNLWVGTDRGLSRFDPRAKTFTNYYQTDGLTSEVFDGFPVACRSRRGEMFFGSTRGLTSFWPDQIAEKPVPPPVVLTGFSLLNRPVDPGKGSVLAKSITFTRSLTLSHEQNIYSFEFAALSYMDPSRNQYRYMLEGLDHSWNRVDSGHRIATYTTLPPGNYTLRVQGSNTRGVWNTQGVALRLTILPPWWGTWWFRIVCAVILVTLLWAAYRYRLRQLQWAFNIRLEERVDERTRIARELHDTLLQSFQALVIVFQAARNLLPGRADQAADILDDGLQQAAEAIAEGRNAIQNLRANPSFDRDLESLLNAAGEQLAHSPEAEGSSPTFRVIVEGSRQRLAPVLQDDVYRIGRELLRNAFRHAHADRIEVEIRYESGWFRLRVRDDGKGIGSTVLKEGVRRGHWGLPGMQERAKSMGGHFKIWSEPGAGTEAELTVPARIAYEKPPSAAVNGKPSAGDPNVTPNGEV